MTIRDYFDSAVAERPAGVFLRYRNSDHWETLTYAEARASVLRILAVLLKLGLSDEMSEGQRARVALMRENCPEWVLSCLAVVGSGFVMVPVDPKLTSGEAEHILTDSGASVILADDRACETLASIRLPARVVSPAAFAAARASVSSDELSAAEQFWTAHAPTADDLASIVYTSGTTGRPKGAMLSHGNFTANVEQTFRRVMFYESDHFLLVLPLFHVYAFTLDFLIPLCKRSEISFARSARLVGADMLELKPSVLMVVPLLAELLYAHARETICRLRVLGVGGAPMAKSTLDGLVSAGVFVLEGYGITECSPGVCYPDEHHYVPGTVGTPMDGMEWRIVDSDETGAGELRVKGPNVMRGYWNNPAETARAFDEDGFYCTGDIVRPGVNGNFTICGRIKALIVNREGKNIYPEEIERTIARCPFVRDVIVVGYRTSGETGEHVGAIVVPDVDALRAANGGMDSDNAGIVARVRAEVRALCHAGLAEYKLPRKIDVRFVPLERTTSMKVKRFIYARALDE